MGTERPGARRSGGLDLPPVGWMGDDGQDEMRRLVVMAKKCMN